MDTVYIIIADYFFAQRTQIVGCARHAGVEIPRVVVFLAERRVLFQHGFAAHSLGGRGLEARDGHHPGVQLHAPFVAGFDGKGQRVVARIAPYGAAHAAVPRFDGRGVDHGAPHTGLQQHRVDTYFFQAVQNVAQLLLLFPARCLVGSFGFRPVQTAQCGEPHGAALAFGSLYRTHIIRSQRRDAA